MAKKPAPKEITKLARFRDEEGNAIDKSRQGKLKSVMSKALQIGSKGKARKSAAYNKGGMVKGKGMACGGMAKKGKK